MAAQRLPTTRRSSFARWLSCRSAVIVGECGKRFHAVETDADLAPSADTPTVKGA
jgi:hypothetical protein